MNHLIMEFWTDRKEAEIPLIDLKTLTIEQAEAFGVVQKILGRRVLVRMEYEALTPLLDGTLRAANPVR